MMLLRLQSHILDQDSNPWPWTVVHQAMPLNHRRSFCHYLPPKTRNFPVSTKFFGTQSCFISKNFNESGFFCQKCNSLSDNILKQQKIFDIFCAFWIIESHWAFERSWSKFWSSLRLFLRTWDLMESFPIFYPLTHLKIFRAPNLCKYCNGSNDNSKLHKNCKQFWCQFPKITKPGHIMNIRYHPFHLELLSLVRGWSVHLIK